MRLGYSPFGQVYRKHTDKTFWKINSGVNANRQLGQLMPYQFTGGYTDGNTGLVHLDARWYNPHSSQFQQPDYWNLRNTHLPAAIQHELMRFTGLNTAQLLNDPSQQLAYGYVSGNPLAWVDPLGLGYDWSESGTRKRSKPVLVNPDPRFQTYGRTPMTADGILARAAGDEDVYKYTHVSPTEKVNVLTAASIIVGPVSFVGGITLGVAAETIRYNETNNPDEYLGSAISGVTKVGGVIFKPLKPIFDSIENFNIINSITSVFDSGTPCKN
jgi:RHS repeat-associated protein